jgi:hypothetical protein
METEIGLQDTLDIPVLNRCFVTSILNLRNTRERHLSKVNFPYMHQKIRASSTIIWVILSTIELTNQLTNCMQPSLWWKSKSRSDTENILKYSWFPNMQYIKEEVYLLGYTAVKSVESQPTFRRSLSPAFSGQKNKPCEKPAWSR